MLEAEKVAFSYTKNSPVLTSVTAAVESGSFLAILGVNGCGKSTLLSCMDDLLKPQGGTIRIDGTNLQDMSRNDRAQQISFVAQHSHANRLVVYDAVLLGRRPHMQGAPTQEDHEKVEEVLSQLGLQDYALRYIDELSGGEYQKVILARAFVQEANILLLDEPTNNLDPANQQEVMKLVRTVVDQRNLAAAAVLHDVNLALRYCDRFLMLKDGTVEAYGTAEVITEASIASVYGIKADIIKHNGHSLVIPQ